MSSQHSTLFWPGRGGRERKAKKQASLVTCGGASLLWLTFSTLSRIWPMQFLPVALNTFLEMRWSFKLIQSLLSKLRNYFDSFFWAAFISYYPLSFLPAEVIPFFGEKKNGFCEVFLSVWGYFPEYHLGLMQPSAFTPWQTWATSSPVVTWWKRVEWPLATAGWWQTDWLLPTWEWSHCTELLLFLSVWHTWKMIIFAQ